MEKIEYLEPEPKPELVEIGISAEQMDELRDGATTLIIAKRNFEVGEKIILNHKSEGRSESAKAIITAVEPAPNNSRGREQIKITLHLQLEQEQKTA